MFSLCPVGMSWQAARGRCCPLSGCKGWWWSWPTCRRAQQSYLNFYQRHWWAWSGGGHLQGPMWKRLFVGFLERKVPSQELNRSKIFLKTVPTSHKVDQLRWLSLSLSLSGASWKQGEVVIQCASCNGFYGKPKRSLGNTLPWRKIDISQPFV